VWDPPAPWESTAALQAERPSSWAAAQPLAGARAPQPDPSPAVAWAPPQAEPVAEPWAAPQPYSEPPVSAAVERRPARSLELGPKLVRNGLIGLICLAVVLGFLGGATVARESDYRLFVVLQDALDLTVSVFVLYLVALWRGFALTIDWFASMVGVSLVLSIVFAVVGVPALLAAAIMLVVWFSFLMALTRGDFVEAIIVGVVSDVCGWFVMALPFAIGLQLALSLHR
jgi:hypothetical protein